MAADEYFASGGVISWSVPGQPYSGKDDRLPAMLSRDCAVVRYPRSEQARESLSKYLSRLNAGPELDYLWEPRD